MGPERYSAVVQALVLFVLATLATVAHAAALDRLKSFVEGTKSARAAFTQTVVAKSGRKPQTAAGTMMFARPGKFRWVYDKPYYQLIVGDGEKLWIYDRDLNQVTAKKLSAALGTSPAALLAGDNALEKNFTLREGGESEGIEWVEAQPKAADASFESLRIGFAGDVLRAMELRDNFGQTTTLVFSQFERNPALPASLFRFVPPKGADVIGE
ncbi:MAG: outer membrane lipoprotein chaperone LolA [Rhodocyclales bacterium]|nr:outer membrane lipoprotein chaperone LolA [Rhodocyclales bacterium]